MKKQKLKKGLVTIFLSVLFIPVSLESHLGTTPLEIKAAQSNLEINLPKVYILPTSPLYDLKTTWEQARLFLSKDPENRTELLIELSEVRLAETLKLLNKDKVALAKKTYNDYKQYLTLASSNYEKLPEEDKSKAFMKNKLLANDRTHKLFTVFVGEYEIELK